MITRLTGEGELEIKASPSYKEGETVVHFVLVGSWWDYEIRVLLMILKDVGHSITITCTPNGYYPGINDGDNDMIVIIGGSDSLILNEFLIDGEGGGKRLKLCPQTEVIAIFRSKDYPYESLPTKTIRFLAERGMVPKSWKRDVISFSFNTESGKRCGDFIPYKGLIAVITDLNEIAYIPHYVI